MIAEDYSYSYQPKSSIALGTTVSCIIGCFKNTVPFFKKVLTQPNIIKPLNENKLTQIFVEQLKVQMRKIEVSFDVGSQYSDIFHGTKGVPDFYFHHLEAGISSTPLFIVEAKRLPAPDKINKIEYVKGKKKNGGIERFKIGKHGKGASDCGILAFLEKEDCAYWLKEVNSWIVDLSKSDMNWNIQEVMTAKECESDYSYLTSIAHVANGSEIALHHFWV